MLALGRALMLEPRVLLIDELSLGLAPVVVERLLHTVRALSAAGTTVVLVEQSVNIALSLATTAYFLERGTVRSVVRPPTWPIATTSSARCSSRRGRGPDREGGLMDLVVVLDWPFHIEFPVSVMFLGAIVACPTGCSPPAWCSSTGPSGSSTWPTPSSAWSAARGASPTASRARANCRAGRRLRSAWSSPRFVGVIVERTLSPLSGRRASVIVLVATIGAAQLFVFVSYLILKAIDGRAWLPAPVRRPGAIGWVPRAHRHATCSSSRVIPLVAVAVGA